jgi:hypothetical protein
MKRNYLYTHRRHWTFYTYTVMRRLYIDGMRMTRTTLGEFNTGPLLYVGPHTFEMQYMKGLEMPIDII